MGRWRHGRKALALADAERYPLEYSRGPELAQVLRMTRLEMPFRCGNMDEDAINTLAQEVATYLSMHPNAADTVEGIRRWWLTRVRVAEATADMQLALDVLVVRGVVVQRRLPDGRFIYAATPRLH